MRQNLSSKLQEIYDLALASGNMAARVVDSPHVAMRYYQKLWTEANQAACFLTPFSN